MIGALLAALIAAPPTVVEASVSDDLSTLTIATTQRVAAEGAVHVVLAAERYRRIPDDLPPTSETELYAGEFDPGGFDDVEILVNGAPCRGGPPEVHPTGEVLRACAARGDVVVTTRSTLVTPYRFGPFSRHAGQLTLAAGWYPYVAAPGAPPVRGAVSVRIEAPPNAAVVIGDRWFGAVPAKGRRTLEVAFDAQRQVPLVVLPPGSGTRSLAKGRARLISKDARRLDAREFERRVRELDDTLTSAFAFLERKGWPVPEVDDPVLLVEAPLRHDLARAADGVVLVSDRAFRLTPLDRFLRFHRFPILREVFGVMTAARIAGADPLSTVGADAVAAWLVDRYVADRYGEKEDVFDVLSLFSFIPAVDSMLYAPQFPFVGAYFRLIRETDPLRAELVDFPAPYPRGKLVYEKLLDRVGPDDTAVALEAIGAGTDVVAALRVALCDDTDAFLETWLGDYPAVQYLVGAYASRCEPDCRAEVTVQRTGEAIAEPVELLLVDEDGGRRLVKAEASTDVQRTVTATLAAPLSEVILDPRGRLAETPSVEVPSPKFDNRTDPQWRFLLNNFNVLYSPTAQNIDTALDLGFSRVRDVRWRFAARASYAPDAIALSTRATYYFGAPLTPDRLSQWIGGTISGEYLRPEFAGETEAAYALSGAIYYGWDTRRTVWVPEAGEAVRAAIGFDRLFGDLSDEPDVTPNAVSFSLRGLKAWRFDAAHQLSVRASVGAFVAGTPRPQLLYAIGGRNNVRGYVVDDEVGRVRGIVSGEWLHPILKEVDENVVELFWATKLDGAFFADVALIGDDLADAFDGPVRADVGYGFRIYLDYFGVRPGVMAIDLAFPLVDASGRFGVGSPAVYIDFSQSFLSF